MESIVKNFNPDINFWEINPIYKTIALFRNLYEEDKSKNKASSSKLVWAIVLLVDPNEANPWRNINYDDRKDLIADEYLRNPKFDWEAEDVLLLIKEYERRLITPAEREYLRLMKKMEERGDFIETTKYSLDDYDEETGKVKKGTAGQLDKMMVDTIKIYEQMDAINGMLHREKAGGTVKGSGVESASEKGTI